MLICVRVRIDRWMVTVHAHGKGDPRNTRLLTGWKAIAQHFGRTQSTVRRWADTADLPVYRAAGEKGLSVYAYADELDAWLTRRRASETRTEAYPEAGAGHPATPARKRGALARMVLIAGLSLIAGGGAVTWTQLQSAAPPASPTAAAIPEEARELYLRGTYLWNRRTPEGIAGAIEALTRATEIHPDYAEAHAGLAMTYNLARQYSGMPGWKAYAQAEEAARRAIELDPGLDLAQAALAFIEFHWHWRVEAGLARFEEAIRLNPDSANAHMWYASSLLLAGRPQQALPIVNRAQALDPHNSAVVTIKAQALFYSGRAEEARELVETTIREDPNFAWSYYTRYMMALAQGDHAAYLDNYARLGDVISVPRYRAAAEAGAAALATGGPKAMARAMFDVERAFYERGEALAWDLARHHALIGDAEQALQWLRISLKRREERLIGIRVDPAFWPIRDHPEYSALLREIGFPAEPESAG